MSGSRDWVWIRTKIKLCFFAVQEMARAYAARLGCIAMVFGLLRQPFDSGSTSQALLNAIGLLIAFAVIAMLLEP